MFIGERVRGWVSSELEVVVSAKEALKSKENLIRYLNKNSGAYQMSFFFKITFQEILNVKIFQMIFTKLSSF